MARSQGDPRVLFVMNLVLSALFCYLVLQGLAFIDALDFSWPVFGGMTVVLMVITHAVTR